MVSARRVLASPDMSPEDRAKLAEWLAEELDEPVEVVTDDDRPA